MGNPYQTDEILIGPVAEFESLLSRESLPWMTKEDGVGEQAQEEDEEEEEAQEVEEKKKRQKKANK